MRINPLQQFWREHMLAQAMIQAGIYDEGTFALIAPRQNQAVQRAVGAYACQLAVPIAGQVSFLDWHLDTVIDALRTAGAGEHAQALHRRYCDFWQVDGEIELALAALRNRADRRAGRVPAWQRAQSRQRQRRWLLSVGPSASPGARLPRPQPPPNQPGAAQLPRTPPHPFISVGRPRRRAPRAGTGPRAATSPSYYG